MPEHYEPQTPIQTEAKLSELSNLAAQAELEMRKLLEAETEAKWAYERAHIIAATDPECPKPTRGGFTVGERESWIRGMCQDEFQGYEYAQLNVQIQKRYIERLNQQVSIQQTIAKFVLQAYNVVGANPGRY